MALPTVLEKLQIKDERNFLIQGLPSSIEKPFAKMNYAKSVTPLLRIKKIDFALIFAVNLKQLAGILLEVVPALQENAKFWVAYPKLTSKIYSELCRDYNWNLITNEGFECVYQVAIDSVWTAIRFQKTKVISEPFPPVSNNGSETGVAKRAVHVPEELSNLFISNKPAAEFFETLSITNKKEYVEWVESAKKKETRQKRVDAVMEKLVTGKKSPTAK